MDKLLYDVELMKSTIDNIYAKQLDNRKHIEELIYDMVESKGGSIDFTDPEKEEDMPYISYNGENHPEYRSTLTAEVQSIKSFLSEWNQRKTFSVELNDLDGSYLSDSYDAYNMSFDDVTEIFDFVKHKCYGMV